MSDSDDDTTTTTRRMHPVARRCLLWGVIALVGGAVLLVYLPNLVSGLSDYAGSTAAAGLEAADVVLVLVRWSLMPLGSALIAAAIVVQTLAPPVDD